MSLKRVWRLLRKELSVGPRKPFFIWALLMPFALTVVFQFAFGSLFDPKPRLAIIDDGQSEITASLKNIDGFDLYELSDVDELMLKIEKHDVDAGIIIPAGFDQMIRAGEKPLLEYYISGESLASNRIIISMAALDIIRNVEGSEAPVMIETVNLGEPGLPISLRLVPIIVFYALVMAGVWVPSSSLVEEKERGTLKALLVTSATINEILASKWLLGFIFSVFLASATLLINSAFGPRPFDVLIVVMVAAGLNAMIGLLLGVYANNATTLFTLIKSLGIFLFVPVIFYLFPDWPQWIAKLFPLYWVIEPVWSVSVMGQPLQGVWFELLIAVAITLALVPLLALLKKRLKV